MRTEIRLSEGTTVADIAKWRVSDVTVFVLGKSASFEPGAQGVALSALRTIGQKHIQVEIDAEFERPRESASFRIFATAFGFALTRYARRITFRNEPTDASIEIKQYLGRYYRESGGVFGSGRESALICADPRYPMPPALEAASDEFPLPSSFERAIGSMAASIGFPGLLTSATTTPIGTFVYELFRNTAEHGIANLSVASRSTRALLVEKIALQGQDLSRRSFAPWLKSYLMRVVDEARSALDLGVACITVTDQGNGIQNTLPPKDGETSEQRLVRAFGEGESSKSAGVTKRGLGLPHALAAAHKLNGLIRISSGGLQLSEDFSTGAHKYPAVTIRNCSSIGGDMHYGTSICMFVPVYTNPDQPALFQE